MLLTTSLENINRTNDCSMLVYKESFKKKTQYLLWHDFPRLFSMAAKEICIILLIFVLFCFKENNPLNSKVLLGGLLVILFVKQKLRLKNLYVLPLRIKCLVQLSFLSNYQQSMWK